VIRISSGQVNLLVASHPLQRIAKRLAAQGGEAAGFVAFDTSIRSEFQSNRRTAARLANRPPESREFARANGKGVPVRKIRLADLLRQAQQVRKVFARAAAGQAEPELETGRSSNRRFRLQRSHVDHEAILDVLVEHALPGLIDLLNGNYLNVSRESMLGAEIQHFLSLCNAPD
jgi:hypothetical protein